MIRRLLDWLVPDRALRGIGVEAGTMPVILTGPAREVVRIRHRPIVR